MKNELVKQKQNCAYDITVVIFVNVIDGIVISF